MQIIERLNDAGRVRRAARKQPPIQLIKGKLVVAPTPDRFHQRLSGPTVELQSKPGQDVRALTVRTLPMKRYMPLIIIFCVAATLEPNSFSQTQAQLTQGEVARFKRADARLNQVYKKVLASGDEESQDRGVDGKKSDARS